MHFSTTPRPCSRQPLLSSQINKQSNIQRFRPVLPSPFCISLWPSRRAVLSRQTQCPKTHFTHNASTKYLKQGALILTCNHNNDPEGSVQFLTVLAPTLLPLNPFQSFVLHGTWAGCTNHPNNSDLYPCWSMFGDLKPPTNARPATYRTRTPFPTSLRRCIVAQHPVTRPWNDSQYSTSPRSLRHQRQVVDWFQKARFMSLSFRITLAEVHQWFFALSIVLH